MSGFEIRGIQNVSFVDLKTGKKINIENAEAPVLSESRRLISRNLRVSWIFLKQHIFTCELTYLNKKELFQALYGTTNNYRRLHGGYVLRETTRRKYIMKHKR